MAHEQGPGMSVEELWKAARQPTQTTLYVLGAGFDPRAVVGLERYLGSHGGTPARVLLIHLPPRQGDEITNELARANRMKLEGLVNTSGAALYEMQFPPVLERSSAGLI